MRTRIDQLGVFGELTDADGNFLFHTLEHSYPILSDPSGTSFTPKIPDGGYTCLPGTFTLAPTKRNPDPKPFSTFQIMGVVGHTDLLFHVGNYNADSSGCVLLGEDLAGSMLLNSSAAFDKFMGLQGGLDSFKIQFQTTIAL
jgi:hypothetical protein